MEFLGYRSSKNGIRPDRRETIPLGLIKYIVIVVAIVIIWAASSHSTKLTPDCARERRVGLQRVAELTPDCARERRVGYRGWRN